MREEFSTHNVFQDHVDIARVVERAKHVDNERMLQLRQNPRRGSLQILFILASAQKMLLEITAKRTRSLSEWLLFTHDVVHLLHLDDCSLQGEVS